MNDRPTRIPQYQYLYESLRQQIIRGDFKSGDLLPSEKDLQNQFRLTQPTIRQALGLLVQDGYIRKHQGKGSIVQPLPIGLGVMSIVGRLANTANTPKSERISTTILTKPRLHPFPDDFLFTPTEEDHKVGFYYLERLRAMEEEPVFFEKVSLPNRYLPGFSRQRLENRSLFDLLRAKYGLLVKGGEQKILAVPAEGDLAVQLGVVPQTPVLRLDKRLDTNRPDFSFYSSLYARTDSYILHGRF